MRSQCLPTIAEGADPALRAMFEARKRVFVDLLKWNVPVLQGRYEADQFDTSDASYLVLTDEGGNHCASARLLRTDQPHILSELFPHLCDGTIPSGPTTREITRFCLEPTLTARERRSARNQLVTALAEHALACGITDYTGVASLSWFRQVVTFGWDCSALGPAGGTGPESLMALHIRIGDQTLDGLARTGIHAPPAHRLAVTGGVQ